MASNDTHVLPVDDLIEHVANEECICGPTTKPVNDDGVLYGWLLVHHSLDGRELSER